MKGNFKDVPIGHEFKFGSYIAVKISATHGKIKYANGSTEDRYIYPTLWVEYNPSYPQLHRTDTKIKG
jgi:hypothetical protein